MLRLFGAALVAAAVLAGVVLGGYEAGWWLCADATNESSYGFQQSRLDELHQDVTTIAGIGAQIGATTDPAQQSALRAQGHAITASACADAWQVAALPIDLASFVSKNCHDGTVAPFSQYAS